MKKIWTMERENVEEKNLCGRSERIDNGLRNGSGIGCGIRVA